MTLTIMVVEIFGSARMLLKQQEFGAMKQLTCIYLSKCYGFDKTQKTKLTEISQTAVGDTSVTVDDVDHQTFNVGDHIEFSTQRYNRF